MAERPIFVPVLEGPMLVKTHFVEFQWFPGMSVSQKQKSVDSLHLAARRIMGIENVLEVSSKSREKVGVSLSAFNLSFQTLKHQYSMCVECAYQGSKVFEAGGPYNDLYGVTAREAKRDERLRSSGRLTSFRFCGVDWGLQPQTAFYDWLYVNALKKKSEVVDQLVTYSAFTDIEFNPEKSVNCQAYSVALFISLFHRGLLSATQTKDSFLDSISNTVISNSRQEGDIQRDFDSMA
jgi:hypothetical protein